MFNHKILVSTSLIGVTGYNNHAQSFFRALSKYVPLEIRNFTIGQSWQGYSDEPHNNEPYIDDELKTLLKHQSLRDDNNIHKDHPIYQNYPNPGKANINLVLNETNHHYFYEDYSGYNIAYNVWESTLQPPNFFEALLKFDELWVPSKWQRDCTIKQGYPKDKIFVIPEGVDTQTFFPVKVEHPLTNNPNIFTFGLFGRWDYRKSTKEIIETWLKTFKDYDNVQLLVSIDNPFSNDGFKTTEDRLKHYNLLDDKIKILHLPPRDEYVKLMKSINVFLSCSRSEGWNLPLIEAMACGVPSIYSNCCAQLEFAENKGLKVNIIGEKPASLSDYNHFNDTIGNYYEPDFEHLSLVLLDSYNNYKKHKVKALKDAKIIAKDFNWDKVAKLTANHLKSREEIILDVIERSKYPDKISYHFVNRPHLEVIGGAHRKYRPIITNKLTNKAETLDIITNNMWVSSNKKYYVDWNVKLLDYETDEVYLDQDINLENKRVYISLDSKAIGDTLAWFPAIEIFRKKHNAKIISSTFHNHLFIENYPNIEFVEPGVTVHNLTAAYSIGWYYNDDNQIDFNKNPIDPKPQPMQKTAFDILGLEYKETKPILTKPKVKKKNQIAIAIHSTAQSKYWNNPTGWQEVVDWCKANNYEVLLLSREEDGYMGNPHPRGIKTLPNGPLNNVIAELLASKAFIGIGSGLSWLSWALDVPTILISGFSYPYTEPQQNTFRVKTPLGKCSGCFNRHKLDPSNWLWCPDHSNTERMFECSRSITSNMVIEQLKLALNI